MKNGHAVIVAELTNNHCGDAEKIRKMVRLSKDAGADIVKIQKRNVLSFYTKEELQIYYKSPFGTTLKDYREGVELDDELIKVFLQACRENEIIWSSSILDLESYNYMLKYDPYLIKLPSTISNHRNFLKKSSITNKN